MPNAWNFSHTEGDEWQSADVYLPFVLAINERLKAVGTFPFSEDLTAVPAITTTNVAWPRNLNDARLGVVTDIITFADSPLWVVNHSKYGDAENGGYRPGSRVAWDTNGSGTTGGAGGGNSFYAPLVGDAVFGSFQGGRFSVFPLTHSWQAGYAQIAQAAHDLLTKFYDLSAWTDRTLPPSPLSETNPTLITDILERKREKEITSLSVTGMTGKARFTVSNFARAFDVALPGTDLPATPSGERKHTGKVFQWIGSAWVEQPPGTLPDIVSYNGLPKPGDIMGPWFLNSLRDAINELDLPYVTQHGGQWWGGAVWTGEYDDDEEKIWEGSPGARLDGSEVKWDADLDVYFDREFPEWDHSNDGYDFGVTGHNPGISSFKRLNAIVPYALAYLSTHVAKTTHFYFKPATPEWFVFNSQGDGVPAPPNVFFEWSEGEVGPHHASEVISVSRVGDLSTPSYPSTPPHIGGWVADSNEAGPLIFAEWEFVYTAGS